MKKMMKKLIAMAAALVMIVTLLPAVGAKAETIITENEATLVIDKHDSQGNSLAGAKFNIYKVAGIGEVSSTQLSYTVEEAFKDVIDNEQIQKLGSLSTSDLEALAEKCAAVENLPTAIEYTSTKPAHGISILDNEEQGFGLYLVVEESAPTGYVPGAPFFVHIPQTVTTEDGSKWEYGVRVTPKNGSTVLDKTVTVNGKDVSAANVKNGDTISYKVEGYLPYLTQQELAEDTIEITIKDTLSNGLNFKKDGENILDLVLTINDEQLTAEDDYTLSVAEDGKSFTITINDKAFITQNNGESVLITYDAYVTDASYMTPATNKAEIIFDEKTESESTIPEVYTYAIEVDKIASDTEKALEGVEFELYDNEDCTGEPIAVGTTDNNGIVQFDGLEVTEGGKNYWLKETKTVNGYTLLSKAIKITLIPEYEGDVPTGVLTYKIDDGKEIETGKTPRLAVVDITNNKGFSLPETGGMGTYLFTIGGIVIMAGAAFALIAMKKRA